MREVLRLPGYLRVGLVALALGLATLAANATAEPRLLNLLGWGDYFDPRVLDEFTAATGIRIVYDTYSSQEALEKRLRAAGDYDVLVVPGPALRTLIAAGALRKLDRSKLNNFGNLWPEIMARLAASDPGNQYAVPYLWMTEGLAFDARPGQGEARRRSAGFPRRRVPAGSRRGLRGLRRLGPRQRARTCSPSPCATSISIRPRKARPICAVRPSFLPACGAM